LPFASRFKAGHGLGAYGKARVLLLGLRAFAAVTCNEKAPHLQGFFGRSERI
jgi:hypothetical protein